jgi:hypothetical protein
MRPLFLLTALALIGCPAPPESGAGYQYKSPYRHNAVVGSDAEEDVFPVVGRRYCLAGQHVRVSYDAGRFVQVVDEDVPPFAFYLSEYRQLSGSSLHKDNWYKFASPDQDPCPSRSDR